MAGDSHYKYYNYDPSLAAAVIYTILFAATTLLHIYQLIRSWTWYFTALVIGGIMESIGYVGRIVSSRQTPNWTLGPFLVQALLLLVAPSLVAASIYMVLGRIILLLDGEKHSMIKKKWLTKVFVLGDFLSFAVLSYGSSMETSKTKHTVDVGQYVILGGLFIQILAFGMFMIVTLVFLIRVRKDPTPISSSPSLSWKKHLYVLIAASCLIMVRSIVRVVEYAQGNSGFILSHEVFLYIFDGSLVFVCLAIFNLVHPSELIKRGLKGTIESEEMGEVALGNVPKK